MALNNLIKVEVTYARLDKQQIMIVEMEEGGTIETAIQRSGILTMFPEIDLTKQTVGIFSKPRLLSDAVKDGDRVEIYRALQISPMEARRQKAKAATKARVSKGIK